MQPTISSRLADSDAPSRSLREREETPDELSLRKAVEVGADTTYRRSRRTVLLARLTALVVLLAFWQLSAGRLFDSFFTSAPVAISRALAHGILHQAYLANAALTIEEALLGYVIGASIALCSAFVLTTFQRAYDVVEPFVLAFYAIPRIALAPLFIMWFGIGITPKVVIAGVMVFFVVFMNTVAGVRSTNRDLINLSRLMGANRIDLLRHIIVPSALPYILTALRIVVPTSFIGAIVGEFISAQRGIGFVINEATFSFDTAGAMAGILILLVSVLVVSFVLGLAERRLTRWFPGTKE